MKRIQFLPNILTALGLICGLFVIFKLNMTGVGAVNEQILKQAAAFLLLAGLFDLLDGALARAMHVESEFGGLFDSLADAVTFGVAPSVIVLKSVSADPGSFDSFLITTGALIYSMCGILRLVRFNTSDSKERHDDLDVTAKYKFVGLPIPAAASAVVSLDFFLLSEEGQRLILISQTVETWVLTGALALIGYLMISRLRFPSLKGLQTRVASPQIILATILLASAIFYGFIYNFSLAFFSLSWGYLIFSWFYPMLRMLFLKFRVRK